MSRIVVDPVTRIEGHLRIEAQVDGGQVAGAWASATMWRGLETILTDRDPRPVAGGRRPGAGGRGPGAGGRGPDMWRTEMRHGGEAVTDLSR